jgi:hypothetical protein
LQKKKADLVARDSKVAEIETNLKSMRGNETVLEGMGHLDGGLDPDEWQGFAFGTGVDRLAMLKYGMDDLRAFFDGDVRWLAHYGFGALDVPTLSGGVGARA